MKYNKSLNCFKLIIKKDKCVSFCFKNVYGLNFIKTYNILLCTRITKYFEIKKVGEIGRNLFHFLKHISPTFFEFLKMSIKIKNYADKKIFSKKLPDRKNFYGLANIFFPNYFDQTENGHL